MASQDPYDLSNDYNTPLSPEKEKAFQEWAAKANRLGDLRDYDLRGAFLNQEKEASNGHLPDTYKKPNHPTFSDESQYAKDGWVGGSWKENPETKRWSFTPSGTNLFWRKPEALQQYFKEYEPDADLILN